MLEGYKEYREIPEFWLSSIPDNWDSIKIKHIFKERVKKGYPDKPLLAATQNMGVVPKDVYGNRTVEAIKDLHLLKLAKVGDFVISLRSFQGGIEYVYYEGIISPAYTVMIPNNNNFHFFRYLFKSVRFIELLQNCVTGIREGQNIDYSKLRNHFIPIPPRPEQDQIVCYLDWKVSMINKYINAKKKQIELLKEQKQAIINQAVTKGLEPKAPMRDSGIEWLGKIPEYWEVMRLKHFATVNSSIRNFAFKDKDEVVFLPMENINTDGTINNSVKKRIYEVKTGFTSFAKNDVIIAKITPCFENGKGAFLSDLESEIGFGTTELINLRARENILPEYLYWITMSSQFRILGERTMTGTAGQKRITTNFVSYFTIAIPDISEQNEIIKFIKKHIQTISRYINSINSEIRLLQEYRTRLISDVVTGKVNVQNVKVPEFEGGNELSLDIRQETEGEAIDD
jgi:type I restriction enzyme S subunit